MSDSSRPRYPREPTPRLLEALREAQEEALAVRPERTEPVEISPERAQAIEDLIEWHKGDNLDWDAIERAHYHRA